MDLHSDLKGFENSRYERKFLVEDEYNYSQVIDLIKVHPAGFFQAFPDRYINNIYFDTFGLQNYYDNIEGEKYRQKIRMRWYHDLFGKIEKPVLEFKVKRGFLGIKKSYPLYPFELTREFDRKNFMGLIRFSEIPTEETDMIFVSQPVILNRYLRKYFVSADRKFRITIDSHMEFFKIKYGINLFMDKTRINFETVIELKYPRQDDDEAREITTLLPFRLTKNSKYLQGIERLYL